MIALARMIIVLVPLLSVASCAVTPLGWHDFHGYQRNAGARMLSTPDELHSIRWSHSGIFGFSSPVEGSNGMVYMGAREGADRTATLIQTGGKPSLKKSLSLTSETGFPSTPAYLRDNAIFVATSVQDVNGKVNSFLHRIDATSGGLVEKWRVSMNASARGSPKAIHSVKRSGFSAGHFEDEDYIFIVARTVSGSWLRVYDGSGTIVEQKLLGECNAADRVEIHRDEGFFDRVAYRDLEPDFVFPTPSIEEYKAPRFHAHLVIASDANCQTTAFEWYLGRFVKTRWVFNNTDAIMSSAAIFPPGRMAVFGFASELICLDTLNGAVNWKLNLGGRVFSTPASVAAPIFAVSTDIWNRKSKLHSVDMNGNELGAIELDGYTFSSPAVSANRVYVQTTQGLFSCSYDLTSIHVRDDRGGGLSSPAIMSDGAVVAATANQVLGDSVTAYEK